MCLKFDSRYCANKKILPKIWSLILLRAELWTRKISFLFTNHSAERLNQNNIYKKYWCSSFTNCSLRCTWIFKNGLEPWLRAKECPFIQFYSSFSSYFFCVFQVFCLPLFPNIFAALSPSYSHSQSFTILYLILWYLFCVHQKMNIPQQQITYRVFSIENYSCEKILYSAYSIEFFL